MNLTNQQLIQLAQQILDEKRNGNLSGAKYLLAHLTTFQAFVIGGLLRNEMNDLEIHSFWENLLITEEADYKKGELMYDEDDDYFFTL